jgi:hypothetical protein
VAPVTIVGCGNCGAGLAVDGARTATCPYCASPNVVARPPTPDQPAPRFVVPFAAGDGLARRALRDWIRSRSWFADGAIRGATVEALRGVYVPAYLYSAVARSAFTASIGEHYTETEVVTVKDANGNERTETRTVTRTEYRPLAGRHVGYVTDVVVSASAGLPNAELAAVEPFEIGDLRRYSPTLIAGWTTEEFAHPLAASTALARQEAAGLVRGRLSRFMPGDGHSDLATRLEVEWEAIDPILVPVWVLAVRYRDDKAPLRVVINGQTGAATGRAPISPYRVVAAILAFAAVVAAIVVIHGSWGGR